MSFAMLGFASLALFSFWLWYWRSRQSFDLTRAKMTTLFVVLGWLLWMTVGAVVLTITR